jgi:hypothetical protein
MDLLSQNIISSLFGVGFVLFCESEYSSLRLFKRRTTLFFFICQLAIWSNALETVLALSISLFPNLRILAMLIITMIAIFTQNMSYPIMMLARIRLLYNFSVIIMCIPIVVSATFAILDLFQIRWILTHKSSDFNAFFIIQIITTIILTVQYISINMFFMAIAIKFFQNIFHTRCVIIVNIIVITLQCVAVLIQFLTINEWVVFSIISIIAQIIVRLEIEVLAYIVQSIESIRQQLTSDEYETEPENNSCHTLEFFLLKKRAERIT